MQKTLNRAKLAESLRELAEAGSPVDVSVAETVDQNSSVEINQVGESIAFDRPCGGTGYIFDVEIINQTSKTIYCCGPPELQLPWEDPFFDWLPDPKESPRRFSYFRKDKKGRGELVNAESDSYCFFGGLEYSRDLVLNHTLLKRGILAPGRPLRGLLLATGGTMPPELHHGQWLEPTLSLFSTKHLEYKATVRSWIDRLQAKAKPARKSNLYEAVGTVGSTLAVHFQPGVACHSGIESATPGVRHTVVAERIEEGIR